MTLDKLLLDDLFNIHGFSSYWIHLILFCIFALSSFLLISLAINLYILLFCSSKKKTQLLNLLASYIVFCFINIIF